MNKFFKTFWGTAILFVVGVVVALMVYRILEKKGVTTKIEEAI